MDPTQQLPAMSILPKGSVEVPGLPPGTLPDVKPPGDPTAIARQRLLKWGAVGVALGAGATGVVTALAFKSYRDSKNKSILKPAIWSVVGSAIVGGTLLWIISRGETKPMDERLTAALIGAKLAT